MPALDEQIVRKLIEHGPLIESAVAALVRSDPKFVNAALLRLRSAKRLVQDDGVYWRVRAAADVDAPTPKPAQQPAASKPPVTSRPATTVAASPAKPSPSPIPPKAAPAPSASAKASAKPPPAKPRICTKCNAVRDDTNLGALCKACRRKYNQAYNANRAAEAAKARVATPGTLKATPEVSAIIDRLREKQQTPPSCGNCQFGLSREVAATALSNDGGAVPSKIIWNECRRHAPLHGLRPYEIPNRAFPVTEALDWCGDWKAR